MGVEAPLGDRAGSAELRFEAEAVGVIALDAVLGSDSLGPFELAGELVALAILAGDWLAHPGLRSRDCV